MDAQQIEPDTQPIAAHAFGGLYRPNFLAEWAGAECNKYAFLNCSYFSHANGHAPSLLQLKQHAQALCNLIKTLTVIDHETDTDDAFDWLEDLDTLYTNSSESHNLPLNSVRNQLGANFDDAAGAGDHLGACSFAGGSGHHRDLPAHINHVNELLEWIDHETAPEGGLFSILPHQEDPGRELIQDSILGQWLIYTTTLVQRVAELEAEVANSRDVLAGEAMVPFQLSSSARLVEGKPLLFPQDRYVLANLTPELWDVLNELLTAKQQDQEAAKRATALQLHAPVDGDAVDNTNPLEPIVSIDVSSRLYRVDGSRTIFITPAHALHPGTSATRTMESRPLVQTVVRPRVGTRTTALEQRDNTRLNDLHRLSLERGRQIQTLKGRLAAAKEVISTLRHEVELAELRVGERRESDRALLAKAAAARMIGSVGKGDDVVMEDVPQPQPQPQQPPAATASTRLTGGRRTVPVARQPSAPGAGTGTATKTVVVPITH